MIVFFKAEFVPINRNQSKTCCRSAVCQIYGATFLLRPSALVCVCVCVCVCVLFVDVSVILPCASLFSLRKKFCAGWKRKASTCLWARNVSPCRRFGGPWTAFETVRSSPAVYSCNETVAFALEFTHHSKGRVLYEAVKLCQAIMLIWIGR
jgi:hypothetical protein